MLDLWAHRRLDEEELTQLLGFPRAAITDRREAALARLNASLEPSGVSREGLLAGLRCLSPTEWQDAVRGAGAGRNGEGHEGPSAPEPERSPIGTPSPASRSSAAAVAARPGAPLARKPARPQDAATPAAIGRRTQSTRGRSRTAVAIAIAAAVVIGAVSLTLATSSERGPDRSSPAAADRTGPSSGSVARAAVPLAPVVSGVKAKGTVSLVGSGTDARLRVRLSRPSSPDGPLSLWLYNALDDSRVLARVRGGAAEVTTAVPPDLSRYRYVEIASESESGSGVHSGQSLLRAPVAELTAARAG